MTTDLSHSRAPIRLACALLAAAVLFPAAASAQTKTNAAPAVEGSYALHAAGNAVNFDGLDNGDGWNLASDLALLVDDGCDDLDRDGVTDCAGDCDDGDSGVYPGAPEHCDGVDESLASELDACFEGAARERYLDVTMISL